MTDDEPDEHPDIPPIDAGGAADGPVFDPDELDIADDDRVESLGEDRFVVSADDDGPNVPDRETADRSERRTSPERGSGRTTGPDRAPAGPAGPSGHGRDAPPVADGAAVSRWLAASFENDGFDHGFDATVKVDGEISRHRMVSNDLGATFETLVLWYVRQVSGGTPPEEVLGLLLADSDLPVQHPTPALHAALSRHGLSSEDSIGDLLAAVEEEGGFVVE